MNRVAVVSGGARGIGRGIVEVLLERGVADEVCVLDLAPDGEAQDPRVHAVQCDATDEKSVADAAAQLPDVVHVLVNNVGGGTFDDDFEGVWKPVETWRRHVDLNLTSGFIVSSAVEERLADGGAICNLASAAALVTAPGVLQAYGAAKAGVVHWTASLARSLAPRGIRVNAVAPGMVWTSLYERWVTREFYEGMVQSATPLGRDQSATDIGEAVAFLCSDRAAQITGVTLPVDGGATLPVIA